MPFILPATPIQESALLWGEILFVIQDHRNSTNRKLITDVV